MIASDAFKEWALEKKFWWIWFVFWRVRGDKLVIKWRIWIASTHFKRNESTFLCPITVLIASLFFAGIKCIANAVLVAENWKIFQASFYWNLISMATVKLTGKRIQHFYHTLCINIKKLCKWFITVYVVTKIDVSWDSGCRNRIIRAVNPYWQ